MLYKLSLDANSKANILLASIGIVVFQYIIIWRTKFARIRHSSRRELSNSIGQSMD